MSKVIVIGHKSPDTDSIGAAISYSYLQRQMGVEAIAGRAGELNKESKFALEYFGVEAPEFISSVARKSESDEKQKVILVDHNESKQCVDGIQDAEVIEVVDHHRLGDFETSNPIFMLFCPVGCVNTIIYNLYKMRGIQPTKAVAGMMLSAIISDTVLFRSPTTTDKDREAVKELAELAGVDYEQYGMEMLKAGADISDYSAEQLASNDRKEFESAGNTFTVGQISVMDVEPINAKKDAIMAVLEKNKAEKGYVASYLMVTDILAEDTFLWFTDGAQEIVEAAFEKKADNQCVYLPKVMSRKKQVSPPLINAYAK
ncbi:manganese-dependent inorganic pyrophosphatase [Dialister pneumosintes]|uniref:inorganic diphosphatase n=1 Tax=Dialister pneumosintes TaxID=39950 RepID=A0ABX9MB85_9FIRM|nr:manganese-dependent inorganic pyrophosphatase [Dialister pneumosintes]RID94940.1 manganese-dependent inorganic pyrophosphatase [Dialister pneumosintes]